MHRWVWINKYHWPSHVYEIWVSVYASVRQKIIWCLLSTKTKNLSAWIAMPMAFHAKNHVRCCGNIILRICSTIFDVNLTSRLSTINSSIACELFYFCCCSGYSGCYLPFKMKIMRSAFKMWSFFEISIMNAFVGLKGNLSVFFSLSLSISFFPSLSLVVCWLCTITYSAAWIYNPKSVLRSSISSIEANHLVLVAGVSH